MSETVLNHFINTIEWAILAWFITQWRNTNMNRKNF